MSEVAAEDLLLHVMAACARVQAGTQRGLPSTELYVAVKRLREAHRLQVARERQGQR